MGAAAGNETCIASVLRLSVSLQAVADEEGVFQPFHQFGFLVRQFVRILWVDGREVVFEQRMRFAIQAEGPGY